MQTSCVLYLVGFALLTVKVWICAANDAAELSRFLLKRQLQNELFKSQDSDLGFQRKLLLSGTPVQVPAYGEASGERRRMGEITGLPTFVYGNAIRRSMAEGLPTFVYGNAVRRSMTEGLPTFVYGNAVRRSMTEGLPTFVYGNAIRRSVAEGLYGMALDHSRRMISTGVYGGVAESRELLNRALSTVLKSKKQDAGESFQTLEIEDMASTAGIDSLATKKKVSAKDKTSMIFVPPAEGILPVGQCYCRFDYDWSEWSLSDATCKASLYHRASDPRSGLAKVWLDDYYGYRPTEGGVLLPPNADQISAFLYSDCTPAPPCSCLDIGEGLSTEACFNEIQIYAANPDRYVPDAVLQDAVADGSEHTNDIRTWIQDAFPLDTCANYQGEPYVYAPLVKPTLQAWMEALRSIVGDISRSSSESSSMIMPQILLASTSILVLLLSLLVAKKLVAQVPRPSAMLDQP
ncbi:hypothetical protein CEUSTIGMA_g9153.t1 [Chlamydomonas eustigma]|uniref:CHASE domain-containing protein n=1 Tax=Chlamydomonas eustigma TaxID=1157962 RepID=A0A250XF68_9CHLO|nr:hypothetical protein CEUSTIGMA_g9153.t1 [Chlamydomonas eustigma]|eukprot:GAX81725.1 hypothetical protein CEUSTIGMA_g9153.t1 [Chlamydomonas eustigma]